MIKLEEFKLEEFINSKYKSCLPELYELKNVIENNIWHERESVFDHTLHVFYEFEKMLKNSDHKLLNYLNQSIDKYSRKDIIFLSILLHDVAKKDTFTLNKDGTTSCPNHEFEGSKKSEVILERFDLTNKEKNIIIRIISNHGFFHYLLDDKNGDLEQKINSFKEKNTDIFIELVILSFVDTLGSQLHIYSYKNYEFRIQKYKQIISEYITSNI